MDVELNVPSRPTSSLSHASLGVPSSNGLPHATTTTQNTAGSLQMTLTPRNVKQWADYQAAIVLSNQDGYEVGLPSYLPQISYQDTPAVQDEPGYAASHATAGLGIEQPSDAYPSVPDFKEAEDAQDDNHPSSTSSSRDAHASSNAMLFGYSPSANGIGSPLTWSPDSEHTAAHPPASMPASQTVPSGLSISISHPELYDQHATLAEDKDATLKKRSYIPPSSHQLGSYFSPESSLGFRSASNSPAPPAGSAQWARQPIPFAGNHKIPAAQMQHDVNQANFTYAQPSMQPQFLPAISRETAGTPQVTLSPAFQEQSSTATRPWSPGDYLVYNDEPSQIPLPPSTAGSACSSSYGTQAQLQYHQRSVSPHTSLLAPHPIYTHHTNFPPVASLSPDHQSYTHGYPYYHQQQRHYSNSSATSAASLAAFRGQQSQYAEHYRDVQYSPMSSGVGSYHSESADEGDSGSGVSSSGAFRSPASNLAFSPTATALATAGMEDASPDASQQYSFSAMQIQSLDHLVDRPSSSLSNYSSHQQLAHSAATFYPLAQSAPHPSLQRSISLTVPRRSSAVRNFSHPYNSVYDHYARPQPVPGRRDGTHTPAARSTPDLPVSTGQTGATWVLPSEEDLRLAAIQYGSPQMNVNLLGQGATGPVELCPSGTGNGSQQNPASESAPDNEAGQKTVTARRTTRSASKSTPLNTFFGGQSGDLEVPALDSTDANQSTRVGHRSPGFKTNTHSTIALPSLDKLPASGRVTQGKQSSTSMLLGQSLLPLHMLPTKRSRGRRPVISPELDIAPTVESTTASTMDQVSFTGVTKTGKPKKIFVCRVPGCDKCFRRSEHLKRHIRSIHTHDKRA